MEKKVNETFYEYAHKWKDLVGQVQPPLTDKELNKMFLNTLKEPYYDRMIGNSNKDFSNVVSTWEMIENGVKLEKIENTKTKNQPSRERKERHTQCHTKEEPTIPSTHHNKTMAISLITSMVEMLHKEIINQTTDPWQDSLCYLHQHLWWPLSEWDIRVITEETREG